MMSLTQRRAQTLLEGVDEFTRAYLAVALALAVGVDEEGNEDHYAERCELWDIHPLSVDQAIRVCVKFQRGNKSYLDLAYQHGGYNKGNAGQDFFLTRNGHEAGFWDRGLGEVGGALTEACDPYEETDLYMGYDGYLHFNNE